jgi:hypothetical protein
MTDLLVTSTVMAVVYSNTVPPQSVVTLLETAVTAKNPAVSVLPTHLTTHAPAKGVGEVTDQTTYLPLTLY